MLARVAAVALNTYREAVRARLLHGLFALAVATAGYAAVVGAFALRSTLRVVADVGSASISLYGVIVTVVLSATSLHRELELKTLFPILTRPIRRSEYLVGKFFGTWLTLTTFVAANAAVLLAALAYSSERSPSLVLGALLGPTAVAVIVAWRIPRARTWTPIPWAAACLLLCATLASGAPEDRRVVLASALLTVMEVAVVAAIGHVFAAFSSPFLSALLSLGVFLVGRSADTLAKLPERVFGSAVHALGKGLAWCVPNLMVYVPPRSLLTGESPAPLAPYLGFAALQAVAWCVALLALASWLFRRRDFA